MLSFSWASILDPLIRIIVPSSLSVLRLFRVTSAIAAIEASASPRNPMVRFAECDLLAQFSPDPPDPVVAFLLLRIPIQRFVIETFGFVYLEKSWYSHYYFFTAQSYHFLVENEADAAQ
jgi:hypothetical protein